VANDIIPSIMRPVMVKLGTPGPPREVVVRVTSAFLIFEPDELLAPLNRFLAGDHMEAQLVRDAAEGLNSILSAASLPFQLISDAVQQRRFDRILSAERIRSLKDIPDGKVPGKKLEERSFRRSQKRMQVFLESQEGSDFMRDAIVYDLDRSLRSPVISAAAVELLIQTLVSTWAVFESFARAFIITWINADPRRAKPVLASPDLKDYFGKQVVDIEVIGDHGFNLTGSMGTLLFRGKRLDHLSVIRSAIGALFNDPDVRTALGSELWMLNQRRHLFVHKRGVIDEEYIGRTGDTVNLGQRLCITSEEVEHYLLAVQKAILAISTAAEGSGPS
jgi:hypothetical protein